jgi:small-conductance mechanosensitive channel
MILERLSALGIPPWLSDLMIVAALLTVAVVAALVLHFILCAILDRLFGQRHPLLHSLLRRSRGVARYGFIILMISLVQPLAPLGAETADRLHRILVAAIVILLGWIALTAVDIIALRYTARFKLDVADNLLARKAVTQVRVLHRAADVLLIVITAAFALMTFDSVRQFGISLFASAGVAGIAVGLAARPVLSNLIAGVQLAITQPIRIEDRVIVEGEFGEVEEISATYVVLKLWDLRRMIVPLSYFFEKPFQNWTRASASIIGIVFVYVDYTVPVDRVRAEALDIVKQSKLWDGQTATLQVTDAKESTMELRVLASARNAGDAFGLRCEIREKLLAFLQKTFPGALPHQRVILDPESAAGFIRDFAESRHEVTHKTVQQPKPV